MEESELFFSIPPAWLLWAMLKVPLLEGPYVILSEIQHFVYLPYLSLLRNTSSAPRQQAAGLLSSWGADCEILIHILSDDFFKILLSMSKEAFSSPEKRKRKSQILQRQQKKGNSTDYLGVLCSLDPAPCGCYHQ